MTLKGLLNSQTNRITYAAGILFTASLAAKLLALFRDRLLAGTFGAGEQLDMYFAAFRIPDFLYNILIMGGLTAVFLPVFAQYFNKNKDEAWKVAANIFNIVFLVLIGFSVLLGIFAPFLMRLVAPGFSPENQETAVLLTRIMFFSPILFGASSLLSGLLQYFGRFFAYSLAPVMYNIGIIIGIFYFVPLLGVIGLAWGIVFGALLHVAVQIVPVLNSGFRWRFMLDVSHASVSQIVKLALPRTIGAAAYHINLIVMTAIASTLAVGSIAVFSFADNLQYVPVSLIGISFAVAAFPALSRSFAQNRTEEFARYFSSAFSRIIFFTVPVALLVFILRAQIVRVIFGTGEFGWEATQLTAASLGVFALGIIPLALIPLLVRSFFSMQDTRTPVVISISSVILNILLAIFFVSVFSTTNVFSSYVISALDLTGVGDQRILALPFALSLSALFQFSLLSIFLSQKTKRVFLPNVFITLRNAIIAGVLTIFSAFFALRLVPLFVSLDTFFGVLLQVGVAGTIGFLVYLVVSYLLRSQELLEIVGKLLKRNE
ncbi:MAG TPA: murein biosynthesis integral membrane protein MurJ [Candidatus Wildermuthbacteria bacterium]|nr:murein biosynthesis integral membrane protein MurJ [Candidatus Wildermuthbacteria bacterium]